jgi:hypothetical protein
MALGWIAFDFTGISWVGIGISVTVRYWLELLGRDAKIIKLIPLVTKKEEELLLLKASYE